MHGACISSRYSWVREKLAVLEVQNRIHIFHVVFGENVVFLGICGLHRLGAGGHRGARVRSRKIDQRRVENVHHGKEDQVKRLLRDLESE